MSTLGASDEVHLSCEPSPQLICPAIAEICPVGLAMATVALAVPTVNRGIVPSFSPRCQGTVLRTPLEASTTTRWLAGTTTGPDQTSLSLPCMLNSYVPGGTTNSCFHNQSLLNSSPWP